jgi:hypothetical protein
MRGINRRCEIADITNPAVRCQMLANIFAAETIAVSASGRGGTLRFRPARKSRLTIFLSRWQQVIAFCLDRQIRSIVHSVVRTPIQLSEGQVADSKITLAQGRQQIPLNVILGSHLSKQSKSYFMLKGTYPPNDLNPWSRSVLLTIRRCL